MSQKLPTFYSRNPGAFSPPISGKYVCLSTVNAHQISQKMTCHRASPAKKITKPYILMYHQYDAVFKFKAIIVKWGGCCMNESWLDQVAMPSLFPKKNDFSLRNEFEIPHKISNKIELFFCILFFSFLFFITIHVSWRSRHLELIKSTYHKCQVRTFKWSNLRLKKRGMPELMSLKIYFVSPLFNSTESVFAFENWMKYLRRLGLFFSLQVLHEALLGTSVPMVEWKLDKFDSMVVPVIDLMDARVLMVSKIFPHCGNPVIHQEIHQNTLLTQFTNNINTVSGSEDQTTPSHPRGNKGSRTNREGDPHISKTVISHRLDKTFLTPLGSHTPLFPELHIEISQMEKLPPHPLFFLQLKILCLMICKFP
ncbi:hypothetical protein VP01_362g3 [Puccinia sorghi]|uniref:Uncharacterized protein n=1 Tax=Puccinia sorghi TaxID=27349 RepID=A0A0L6UUP9_9BASI|nr:hypothetical protein VP01_362g3 [Puccinia sorghi]